VVLGDHVPLDAGTGACTRLLTCFLDSMTIRRAAAKHGNRESVGGDGRFLPSTPLFAGEEVSMPTRTSSSVLRDAAAAQRRDVMTFRIRIAGAQDAGIFVPPRNVHQLDQAIEAGRDRGHFAWNGCGVGRAAYQKHDRQAARLVRLASANLGRAIRC